MIQRILDLHLLLSTTRMRVLSFAMILMITALASHAQSISVTGNWAANVSSTAVTEAGNDYGTGYIIESTSNQIYIDVTASQSTGGAGQPWWWCLYFSCIIGPNDWEVKVSQSDINWDSRLKLHVKRTGSGSASGVTLGTIYTTISTSPQTFFRGTNDAFLIPVQYKLSGMSVLIPTGTYNTNVVYTVMDI